MDNEATLVPAVVSTNIEKIKEEFQEEMILGPPYGEELLPLVGTSLPVFTPQEINENVNKLVDDAINGRSCDALLITETGNKTVDCIISDNRIIWFVHPAQ
jgi:hypothetical protein